MIRGKARVFYEEIALSYEGEECLIWPFSRIPGGYAYLSKNGRQGLASRFLCEDIHGPPPTAQHEAAHSCGNGHLGCVNKRHLSWKTPAENQSDRIIHGTHNRGERNGKAELTRDKVLEIKRLKGSKSQRIIALQFGISKSAVNHIHSGRCWAWMEE